MPQAFGGYGRSRLYTPPSASPSPSCSSVIPSGESRFLSQDSPASVVQVSMKRDRHPVVLITGAGRGIGLATAEAFADAGYAVVIAERAVARGRRAERTLRKRGHDALFVRTDVAKAGDAERAVNAAIKRFSKL